MYDKSNETGANATPNPLRTLTPAQFMALGGKAVVYIKPMKGGPLGQMVGRDDFAEDDDFQLVVSADGSPLLIADSPDAVAEWLSDKDIGIVALH